MNTIIGNFINNKSSILRINITHINTNTTRLYYEPFIHTRITNVRGMYYNTNTSIGAPKFDHINVSCRNRKTSMCLTLVRENPIFSNNVS
jgi:hypothetical protein